MATIKTLSMLLLIGALCVSGGLCWGRKHGCSSNRHHSSQPHAFSARPHVRHSFLDSPLSSFSGRIHSFLDDLSFWNSFMDIFPHHPHHEASDQVGCQPREKTGITEMAYEKTVDEWEQAQYNQWNNGYEERKSVFEERENKAKEQYLAQVKAEKERRLRLEKFHAERKQEELRRRELEQRQAELNKKRENFATKQKEPVNRQSSTFEDVSEPPFTNGQEQIDRQSSHSEKDSDTHGKKREEVYPQSPSAPAVPNQIAAIKVPGFRSKDISIKTVGDIVHIRGYKENSGEDHSLVQEFHKSFTLADDIDPKSIQATIDSHGLLTVTAKKLYKKKPIKESEELIEFLDIESDTDFDHSEYYETTKTEESYSNGNRNDVDITQSEYQDDDVVIEVVE